MENFCDSKFWDEQVVWNTSNPDFPQCFQKTVFTILPDALLWLSLPVIIVGIRKRKMTGFYIPWTALNVFKLFCSIVLLVLSIIVLHRNVQMTYLGSAFIVDLVYPTVECITYMLVILIELFHKRRCINSSAILFLFWLLKSIGTLVIFRSAILKTEAEDSAIDVLMFVLVVLTFHFNVAQLILNAFADKIVSLQKQKKLCPSTICSPLAGALYSYFDSIAWTGFKRKIQKEDLWPLKDTYNSANVYSEYDAYLYKYVQKSVSIPSIFKIIWKMNKWDFILAIGVKYIADLMSFVSPLMLQRLINFVTNDEPAWKGYLYAFTMFIASTFSTICLNSHFFRMQNIGIRARAACISAIYRKALKMSNAAKRTATIGEIVNLMSVDAQKLMDVWQYVGHAFSMPLQVTVSIYLLWGLLNYSVLVGIFVIIIMIPANAYVAGKTSKLQVRLMRNKDKRTKLVNEIFAGIKVLKLYAWEIPFFDSVNSVRFSELLSLKRILYLQSVTIFLFQCTPFLISLSTFATYVLIDDSHVLDATKAFVSLSLFDIIRVPLNFVPQVVAVCVQTYVSVKRINKFMNSDELDPNAATHSLNEDDPVVVTNATFSWGKEDEPVLHDIALRIPPGKLVAVVGTVGAGKSSLISAILGEMEVLRGTVNVKESVAYVSQQAWIQNATVKNNVLFGKRFVYDWYERVIDGCALQQDFSILPAGDETEIGEKGINLSGGQKQRVSLARAVYNDADLYLLDDPLSAVDAHVGKHIFEKVIGPKGLLKHKTRLLVTHGIAYLPHVDSIIVLNNGVVSETGSYRDLLKQGGEFAEFIMTYLKEEEKLSDVEMEKLMEIKQEILPEIENETLKRRLSQRISQTFSSAEELATPPKTETKTETEIETEKPKTRRRKKTKHLKPKTEEPEEMKPTQLGKLTQEEQMESGTVDWDVYIHYIKSLGSFLFPVSLIILTLAWSASVGANIWLSFWSSDKPNPDGSQDIGLRDLRLGVYGGLGFAQSLFAFGASITLALGTVRASKILHDSMFFQVLRSPMSFFDTTPLGRIVNRFSRDVDVTDVSIPMFLRPVLDCFMQIVGTVVVISLGNAIFLAIFFPLMIFYYLIQRLYIDASRQLKRLESVSRSPIYSHFSETVSGLPTIRAFQVEDEFIRKLEDKLDYNHILYYPILVAKRWLQIRLDAIGELIVLSVGLFAVIGRDTIDPGTVGLSISYGLSVTFILTWLVRNWTDLETNIVSVERMKEYIELPTEAPWTVDNYPLLSQWPYAGEVRFENYSTSYREGLDLVLKGISCHVSSSEKIGIVGRTGAGKSSLTLALFRIIEARGGFIAIDGVNIAEIGLHDLRGRLTIIPQDPVLFFGSLRMNLDPFSKYSDEEIWRALDHAHLKEFVVSLSAGLEHEIVEGGDNLSVGQRQLVCLARALLRKTKVLILDEATAAVDLETDDLIQATIRKEFADCTVITIAHRLNTIMDSNRVMVLHDGAIHEFDSPATLLQNKDSIFYSMAKDAGLV